ncbi:hypothetical protein NEIPOLOT_01950 [Neisseria polysaccharea ATCC 43768]|nr:hypothetical protein NEIPOLOT_01950 [Neisseria polysaccharea ATCC 43768]
MPSEPIFRRHFVCYHIRAPSCIILKQGGAPFLKFPNSRTACPCDNPAPAKSVGCSKKPHGRGSMRGSALCLPYFLKP